MTKIKTKKNTAKKKEIGTRPTRARNYTFTDNVNTTLETYSSLYNDNMDLIRYIKVGIEKAPTTQKTHLQGWIQFNTEKTFRQTKNILPDGLHIEQMMKSETVNNVYCGKDNNFICLGKYVKQGQRCDIENIMKSIRDGCLMSEILKLYPTQYVRYYKAFENARKLCLKDKNTKILQEQAKKATLKTWQKEVLTKLLNQDDRKVLWVVDKDGNKGKSFLAKYIVGMYNAFYVRGGRSSDIAYNYNYEPITVFDFCRDQEDRINYQVIEDFKDGMLFSPKYESTTKIFPSAKTVIFSNFNPDQTKLSQDRWDIFRL